MARVLLLKAQSRQSRFTRPGGRLLAAERKTNEEKYTMISRLLYYVVLFFSRNPRVIRVLLFSVVIGLLLILAAGKTYQSWDRDPDRGALAIDDGAFGESYTTPVYLEQGWDEASSLWFYNTTQGSGLLPYDFFLVLEEPSADRLFRCSTSSWSCHNIFESIILG